MPYNVLAIAPTSFFADYGCHVRILEEARALGRLGHNVTVCTYHNGGNPEGVRVLRMPRVPWHAEVRVGSHYHKLYFDALLTARSLAAAGPIDLVHAHLHEGALIGYFVSRLRRVPLVFDYQGSLTREMVDHQFLRKSSPFYKPMVWLERMIERLPSAIVTSTANQADTLRQAGHEHVAVLADGVHAPAFPDPDASAVADLRARLGIPAGRDVVGYVGLLAEYQGVGHLIYAARQIVERRPNTHFLIMGYPGLERYWRQAHDLQLLDHVTFTGRVPYDQLNLHLALADVAVSAKMSASEGNGKLLNYMLRGLPTVAYDTPVAREILGELGAFTPKSDITALGHAIQNLLDDPGRRAALSPKLRQRVTEEFSWDATAHRLVALYDSLVQPAVRLPIHPHLTSPLAPPRAFD